MRVALVILGALVQSFFLVVGQENQSIVLTPCIHIQVALSAEVEYLTMDNSTNTATIVGHNYTSVDSCEYYTYTGNASASISWPENEPLYSLTYFFHADFREGRWDFTHILFHIITTDNPAFPGAADDEILLQNSHRIVPDSIGSVKSYQCDSNITHIFESADDTPNNTARLQTRQARIQVFRFSANGTFGSPDMRCVDDISDSKVIPIIIGTLLTVMLVSISTLYIVGRIVKHRAEKKQSFVS